MKSSLIGFLLATAFLIGPLAAGRAFAAEQQPPADTPIVTLRADKVGPAINPFIYGQFIEHLGRCIYGGIWAEMLEDRKFYFPVTPEYHPYRSLEDTPLPVVGASPWQIQGEAAGVIMETKQALVGKQAVKIAAGSGIRQLDLGLRQGVGHAGYIFLKSSAPDAAVEVALVSSAEEGAARQAVKIEKIAADYTKYPFSFTAGQATEKGSLEIRVLTGSVVVGTVSLMPADNVRGMRADTLTVLKQLNATMYRWPGGNFVSGYDWRDGIGPRDQRPPRKNPAWTGVEHNDFGLDEFIDFCREVKAEPVIAANTGFGDAYSAAQEVEYANCAADTIGGSWRAKNGHPQPYGVKYWCVGNEMFGPWQLGFMQLSQYTQKHNLVADAMWAADPSLKLIGSGDLGTINRRHDPDEKRPWSRGMLEACADRMNYISEHFYRDKDADLAKHVRLLSSAIREKAEGQRKLQDELGLKGEKRIPIAMDEWNYWHGEYVYGELGCVYDLADALGVAIGLHEYFRNSDIIQMAHYAQTVNVIGCIKTTKTTAFLDSTALPLLLYRQHYGQLPIEIAVEGDARSADVTAAWTADRKALTIGIVNPTREPLKLNLKPEGAELATGDGKAWMVTGDDPGAHNAPGQEVLKIVEKAIDISSPIEVPPLSDTVIRVPAR